MIEQRSIYRTTRDEKPQYEVKCSCGKEIFGWLESISSETEKACAEHLRQILINNTTHLRKDQMIDSLRVTCGIDAVTAADFIDSRLREWSGSLDVKTLSNGETLYHWRRFDVAS